MTALAGVGSTDYSRPRMMPAARRRAQVGGAAGIDDTVAPETRGRDVNFFLFLGGTRVRYKDTGELHATCPRCATSRSHRRARAGSWVHLYWIPLFRVQDLGDVVICRECGLVRSVEEALGFRHGDRGSGVWSCSSCGNVNPRSESRCVRCGAPV